MGFVLRLFRRGTMCGIELSPWIVCMTFLLALFLAFAKRRDDVVIYRDTGTVTRSNTLDYNLPFLNSTLGVIASVTMVCYIMYTISPEVTRRLDSSYVYVTSVFVLAESYAICSRQQCARRAEVLPKCSCTTVSFSCAYFSGFLHL